MSKKNIIVLLSIILLSFMLLFRYTADPDSGFSETDGNNVGPPKADAPFIFDVEPRQLNVAVFMEQSVFEALSELTRQFEKQHPGIQLRLSNRKPEEAYTYYIEASRRGEVPDIMLMDNIWVNEFAALGYLRPVEFLTGEAEDGQLQSMMGQVKWNGNNRAVPSDADPYVIAWNKQSLLSRSFNAPPDSAQTLSAMADALTDETTGTLGIYFDGSDLHAFLSLLHSLGVHSQSTVLNDSFTPGELSARLEAIITRPETWKAAGRAAQPREALNAGKIAMMVVPVSEIRNEAGTNIGLSLLPETGRDGKAAGSWLRGRSYTISSRSEFPEEAEEWIRYVTSETSQLKLYREGGHWPVSISALQSDQLKNRNPDETLRLAVLNGSALPADPKWPERLEKMRLLMERFQTGAIGLDAFSEQLLSLLRKEAVKSSASFAP